MSQAHDAPRRSRISHVRGLERVTLPADVTILTHLSEARLRATKPGTGGVASTSPRAKEAALTTEAEAKRIVLDRMSEAPIAQRIWIMGGPVPAPAAQDQQAATVLFLNGLYDSLLFLARTIDGLEVGQTDSEARPAAA
jgi:hypothetical protein